MSGDTIFFVATVVKSGTTSLINVDFWQNLLGQIRSAPIMIKSYATFLK